MTTTNYLGTTFVNLTPHAITVNDGVNVVVFPPSGTVARATQTASEPVNGIALVTTGEVSGLPSPSDGVVYIVSAMVLTAVPHRHDVVCPFTGRAKRDDAGRIVSVPCFYRNE